VVATIIMLVILRGLAFLESISSVFLSIVGSALVELARCDVYCRDRPARHIRFLRPLHGPIVRPAK
jgi:hypothetical protein